MLTKIYAENPSERELSRVVSVLERDGVIVCPTDSVYAFACSIRSARAIERLRRMLGKSETRFSALFPDIARVAEYCRVDNAAFRVLKRNLPGPFTFILPATTRLSKAFKGRREVGVRVPDNLIATSLAEALGNPILSATAIWDMDMDFDELARPEVLEEHYRNEVDAIIDGGEAAGRPTAVVSLLDGDPEILRQGPRDLSGI